MRLPSLGSIWRRRKREADPYAEFYLHSKAADPRNLIVNRIREAPEGSVFGVKEDTHTPEVMSEHIKELGRFFGADLVHIASTKGLALGPEREAEALPFAIVCGFRSQHDPSRRLRDRRSGGSPQGCLRDLPDQRHRARVWLQRDAGQRTGRRECGRIRRYRRIESSRTNRDTRLRFVDPHR